MKKYNWSGNIRELKNAVETAYNYASSNVITIEDIPERIPEYQGKPADEESSIDSLKESVDRYEKEIIKRELETTDRRVSETARRLGISKQSLQYKLNKYKLR
ncbi:transcriptional regulator with PAS, ATPase and Fis domain [Geomicrobium halophilum]|uniref:Transcriptional regulator with PAS, ATPase and Fis domain n=1 Tax=Geomicrobium halophilum TaxID=549000 RepID=A0A841Q0A5_9BACL|nr:helix-turn-helix domain-containing protein [Geomicrobium halophilum]MBB6448748.1 transcriptional regulator with PAS, ATPase and Fis domain [Geomicrobium halophilum]